MSDGLKRIRRFNLWMGLVHLVQGALMLVLSSGFALPVTSAFLRFDPQARQLVADPKTLFDIRVGPLVAAFLFISAATHLFVSTFGFDWYRKRLGDEINPARWMEYSLSSSVMIVVIAMLVGVYDVASLILLFGLNASMILFGWTMELQDRSKKLSWLPYWFGTVAGTIPWVAIGIYLFGSGAGGQGPPTFVYFIYLSIFLFFNAFALTMVFQYRGKGQWANYLYGERAYIWLSLLAKSALAWQVFAGTLRPV